MKNKIVLLTALVAMSHASLVMAQSTTTANLPDKPTADAQGDVPDSGVRGVENPNAGTNTSTANAINVDKSPAVLNIKYLGIMHGPGLEFSGTHMASNNDRKDMFLENRVKFLAKTSEKFDMGVEARVHTIFGNDSFSAENGNWRLMADIKNIYKNDILAFSFIPRIMLPTSKKAHDQDMLPSPDLIANFDITPKNSRFSANTGLEYIYGIYGKNTAGPKNYQNANTAVVAPWLELDYQLNPKVILMTSYWPDLSAQARNNAPLAADSNEVDLGFYYEFAKGWQLNPYVAAEMYGMDYAGHQDRNMQLNMIVTGAFL